MIGAAHQVVGSVQQLLGQIIDHDMFPEPNKPPRRAANPTEKAELNKALEASRHLTAVLERIVAVPAPAPNQSHQSSGQGSSLDHWNWSQVSSCLHVQERVE